MRRDDECIARQSGARLEETSVMRLPRRDAKPDLQRQPPGWWQRPGHQFSRTARTDAAADAEAESDAGGDEAAAPKRKKTRGKQKSSAARQSGER